jgi:hypothetical protein
MSFPAVSKHVRILEEAGFVKREIIGREHHIDIEKKSLDKAHDWIESHRRFWTESLDRLEEYLEKSIKEEASTKEKGHEHQSK